MQLHGSGIFQLRVQRLCWGSGILKSNATLRSRQCIQASQFFAATQDVCGKVSLTRAIVQGSAEAIPIQAQASSVPSTRRSTRLSYVRVQKTGDFHIV